VPRENDRMARKKAKADEDPWAYYRSIQLTPKEKAELRVELERRVEEARRNGVYEKLLSFAGKVHLDMDDLRRLREDDD
jgi:hypothetical protein